jgi:coiled-coil domain-containing protein 40
VEAEKQILLWERKIKLEKEMQDTLDPAIGQQEIVEMKKEIHNMEIRYQQMKRKQKELINKIETAVFKRETIQLKYLPQMEKKTPAGKGTKNHTPKLTQNSISRQNDKTTGQPQNDTKTHDRERHASGPIN